MRPMIGIVTVLILAVCGQAQAQAPAVSPAGQQCLNCHSSTTPGVVQQWRGSAHAKKNVDCYSCHQASAGDPATFDHYGQRIAVIVSPKYCARCHAQEVEQFDKSHHAKGAQFIGSLDNFLGEIIEGGPAAVNGCRQCHGSEVKYLGEGKFDADTWPNSGIGRVNPDGSRGTCAACHGRHAFSSAQARQPENCGKCHMGPDHPQIEIYNESKHGIQFRANIAKMNLESRSWVVGKDYSAAPTCATCHMSGFGGAVENTHDVGARLYWELQPPVSVPQWKGPGEVDIVLQRVPDKAQAEKGRAEMKKVCYQCHSRQWSDNYLAEFDKVVSDYNMLFARVDKMLQDAYQEGLVSKEFPLDETPEIMHYLIWHHDGRRWRMGASMMGPDWTHWNGAVDAIMNKLGAMMNDLDMRRRMKAIEEKLGKK